MRKFTAALALFFFSVGIASAQDFKALIKSVKGNKVTINRSDADNTFKDEVLIAIDKVKVTKSNTTVTTTDDGNGNITVTIEASPGRTEIKEGLKSDIFNKPVRAKIVTDAKNNIAEIHIIGGGDGLFIIEIDDFFIEIGDPDDPLQVEIRAVPKP